MLQELWTVVMPHIPAPELQQMLRWMSRFSDAQLEYAVVRTGRKFAQDRINQPVDPVMPYKYTSGVLLHLELAEDEQQWRGSTVA